MTDRDELSRAMEDDGILTSAPHPPGSSGERLSEERAARNTDRHLWRETQFDRNRDLDMSAPSIHVTEDGGIGINVGGNVIVMPLREWHALASRPSPTVGVEAGDWVHVPRVPTPGMKEALRQVGGTDAVAWGLASWPTMLAAAPASPSELGINAGEGVEHHKLDNDRQVFFYEQDYYVLSNFSAFNVKWFGRTFQTSEHAYHWSRFALGWDLTDAAGMDAAPIATLVMTAPSAHAAFKLAQEHRDLQHPDWNRDKIDVMRRILLAKAEQHEYVHRKLLATGDRELIEDSWRDDFWGWGPNRDGQNMLGKLWMEVRAELRIKSTLVVGAP